MVATAKFTDKIVTAFEQAAAANEATDARVGNVITLTPEVADEVMVTGDLHGHRRNFNLIRRKADLANHPRRHVIIHEVCHGGPTYPENGGDMSHAVLEDVAKLKAEFPQQVHFLLGNHELAEMTDYPIQKNKQMLNLLFRLGMQAMYGEAADRVRAAFTPFLKTCPLGVKIGKDIFFSHSIPEGVDSKPFDTSIFKREIDGAEWFDRGPIFHLLWDRDYRVENARAFAKQVGAQLLINGHDPCPTGFGTPNDVQLILDCCTEKGHYVLLRTDRTYTHAELVGEAKPLAG